MSLGPLLSIGDRIGGWRSRSNPFRAADKQSSASPFIEVKPVDLQSIIPVLTAAGSQASALSLKPRFTRTTAFWLALIIVFFVVAAGLGGYGMLQVRHKRELLALGRELKRLENELGKALQENQLLRTYLATQRASQAIRDAPKEKAKPVAHVRTK